MNIDEEMALFKQGHPNATAEDVAAHRRMIDQQQPRPAPQMPPFERRLRAAEARIQRERSVDAWLNWAGSEMDAAAERNDWDRVLQVVGEIEEHREDPAITVRRVAADIDRRRQAEDELAAGALRNWEDYQRTVLIPEGS